MYNRLPQTDEDAYREWEQHTERRGPSMVLPAVLLAASEGKMQSGSDLIKVFISHLLGLKDDAHGWNLVKRILSEDRLIESFGVNDKKRHCRL